MFSASNHVEGQNFFLFKAFRSNDMAAATLSCFAFSPQGNEAMGQKWKKKIIRWSSFSNINSQHPLLLHCLLWFFVEIQCCNTAILTNSEFIGFDQISRSVFVVFLDPAGSMLLSKCFGLQTSIRSFYVADLVGAIWGPSGSRTTLDPSGHSL